MFILSFFMLLQTDLTKSEKNLCLTRHKLAQGEASHGKSHTGKRGWFATT